MMLATIDNRRDGRGQRTQTVAAMEFRQLAHPLLYRQALNGVEMEGTLFPVISGELIDRGYLLTSGSQNGRSADSPIPVLLGASPMKGTSSVKGFLATSGESRAPSAVSAIRQCPDHRDKGSGCRFSETRCE
jgi:hypothetical protein